MTRVPCPGCGYLLQLLDEGSGYAPRCPECGWKKSSTERGRGVSRDRQREVSAEDRGRKGSPRPMRSAEEQDYPRRRSDRDLAREEWTRRHRKEGQSYNFRPATLYAFLGTSLVLFVLAFFASEAVKLLMGVAFWAFALGGMRVYCFCRAYGVSEFGDLPAYYHITFWDYLFHIRHAVRHWGEIGRTVVVEMIGLFLLLWAAICGAWINPPALFGRKPPVPVRAAGPAFGPGPAAHPAQPKPAAAPRVIKDVPAATTFPGLIGYWPLDEGRGTRAGDCSGHDHAGAVVNARWVDGIRGKALHFDGPGSHLRFGSVPKLAFAAQAPFTFAFWVRTHRKLGTLMANRDHKDGSPLLAFVLPGTGGVAALFRPDGNEYRRPVDIRGGNVSDGEWHHVVLTRDGHTLQLFLDGASLGSASPDWAGLSLTTDLRALGAELYHNLEGKGGETLSFVGSIDEVCIFKRALKPEEIKALSGS